MIRYRLPTGSEPPLNDVVGHLVEIGPTLRVRTKHGDTVDVDTNDVVIIKELPPVTVRTADVRNLEHAAALAWPGIERRWVNGWLLRAAGGYTHRANSAVPLGFEADASALPEIVDWYGARGLTPWLSVPDRLYRLADAPPYLETVVMAHDVGAERVSPRVRLYAAPDEEWLRLYSRDVPVDVLTAVLDGKVTFATIHGVAVGRAAVTTAPDGRRWVGLSAVRVSEKARGRGLARQLCSTLLDWGAGHGAARGYVQVLADNAVAIRLYESIGFAVQHRSRYIDARSL